MQICCGRKQGVKGGQMIDFKKNIAGCANLKASRLLQNRLMPAVSRGRIRWSAALHVSALALGTISAPAFAQNWIQELPDNSPSARTDAAMANDGATGQVVLFGGGNQTSTFNDTWSWNGADWTQEFPANSPPARIGHAMAYDAAHGKVVLFGGLNGSTNLSDTWVWDGTDWTQEKPATSPSARTLCTMKYDAARDQVVLFGGYGDGPLNDTWLWNGKNWTQAQPGTSPPARYAAAMAYDAADDRVVLFGGIGPGFDTWTWDGSNWIQKNPSTIPTARALAGMAYDSEESKVVLFGGFGNGDVNLNDTWEWNGSDWTKQNPPDFPSARDGQAMAPDAQGNVVLFGGNNSSAIFSDTWVLAKGPEASLNPASLSFGKQKVKTSSTAKPVELTNSGIHTLTIHSFSLTGSDPKDFAESNNCHGSLKPGLSCTIDVVFKPTAKGARSAKLVIEDNAENGSQSIPLSGAGD
jgi:centrosomal CEP192-like protein/galactose oxidase-like protein